MQVQGRAAGMQHTSQKPPFEQMTWQLARNINGAEVIQDAPGSCQPAFWRRCHLWPSQRARAALQP